MTIAEKLSADFDVNEMLRDRIADSVYAQICYKINAEDFSRADAFPEIIKMVSRYANYFGKDNASNAVAKAMQMLESNARPAFKSYPLAPDPRANAIKIIDENPEIVAVIYAWADDWGEEPTSKGYFVFENILHAAEFDSLLFVKSKYNVKIEYKEFELEKKIAKLAQSPERS